MSYNWKKEFKKYRQPGDYRKIADDAGLAERTICTFFTKRGVPEMSQTKRDDIRLICLGIVRKRIEEAKIFLQKENYPQEAAA